MVDPFFFTLLLIFFHEKNPKLNYRFTLILVLMSDSTPVIPFYCAANDLLSLAKRERAMLKQKIKKCPFLCFWRFSLLLKEFESLNVLIEALEVYFDDFVSARLIISNIEDVRP